jgi:beta-glucanase (GH16 family)
MILIRICGIAVVGASLAAQGSTSSPPSYPGYALVWSDEFARDGPPDPAKWTQPHYLLVNLAVGGTQGGDPSKTQFPARFEIDYVRVYQHNGSAAGGAGQGAPQRLR